MLHSVVKVQFYFRVGIKLECDVQHRQSPKRLQRQKEILPLYIQYIRYSTSDTNCIHVQKVHDN